MVLYRYPSAARDRQEPRHERAPAGSMRLLVLAAALPRIVAFATLPDERMSYSGAAGAGCPPGLLACEEGITFATSEDMLRNVHNAADHPEIDASLQLAKRCVPFGTYAKCVEACWSRTFPSPQFTPFVSISKQMRDWHCSMCRVPCVAHCRAHQLDIASDFLLSGTCTQEYERMGEEDFCAKVSGATSPMPFVDVKYTNPPTDCCALHDEDVGTEYDVCA